MESPRWRVAADSETMERDLSLLDPSWRTVAIGIYALEHRLPWR